MKKIGGMNYEGRFFIVEVTDEWRTGDPLPQPSPEDLWFDQVEPFEAALQGSWNRERVNRRPWNDHVEARPPKPPGRNVV